MPFFADYSLSEPGPDYIAKDAKLFLLLLRPCVCLVLQPCQQDRGDSYPVYRRIGIFRLGKYKTVNDECMEMEDDENWMEGSVWNTVMII